MRKWSLIHRLQIHRYNLLPPVLFLLVCVLAYGVQAFHLGFYLDDWVVQDVYNIQGVQGLREYLFINNRPVVFWMWWLGFLVARSVPAAWQFWTLAWRLATVVILWLVCRQLWPKAPRQVAWASLLFAIYPLFKQQAAAVAFGFHWLAFFLWGLSIYWMIRAVRRPERFMLYMAGALLADMIQLFSQEYYIGLELLRPLVLWLVLQERAPELKERLRRAALTWLPFVVVLIGELVWRTVLMPRPGADRNAPQLLFGLFTAPLKTLAALAVIALQDIVHSLVGVWYAAFEPSLYKAAPLANLLAWGVVGFISLLMLVLFWQKPQAVDDEAGAGETWYRTAIPFGFLAMLLGFLPGWLTGRHVFDLTGMYNDRFGLAAMFGAAILVVALIEALLKKPAYRIILVCLLIGLGTGQQMRFQNTYRWSWEKQSKLYWQFKWRAPELARPTSLYGEGSVATFVGNQVISAAVDLMYGPTTNPEVMDFRYFDLNREDVGATLENKEPRFFSLGYMTYTAQPERSLVFAFEPEKQRCLWILSSKDRTNPYLTPLQKEAVPLSNLNQIRPEPDQPLRADIFGREPAHDWCYFYQKGELAGQYKDWAQVVSLWQQAEQQGDRPRVGVEYGVFIEGFANTGDWDKAIALTRKASMPKYEMRTYLCSTWRQIADTTPESPGKPPAIQKVIEDFECQDEFRAP